MKIEDEMNEYPERPRSLRPMDRGDEHRELGSLRPMILMTVIAWLLIGLAIVAIVGCKALVPETIQDIDRAGGQEAYRAQRINLLDRAALALWRMERDAFDRQFKEEP